MASSGFCLLNTVAVAAVRAFYLYFICHYVALTTFLLFVTGICEASIRALGVAQQHDASESHHPRLFYTDTDRGRGGGGPSAGAAVSGTPGTPRGHRGHRRASWLEITVQCTVSAVHSTFRRMFS